MWEEVERPDPEAMLAQVKEEEPDRPRGRLKIFLGYAAGVGKTYAMLDAARQRRLEGGDVVVAYVETHGRPETEALLEGLEIIPRRRVEYRGIVLEEMDLDAVLARRPQLAVVDELAHTNAPGSRHAKRYQDVLEILHAGIDVYTTLNIQHVESLNDVIAQITGVRMKETVPDFILQEADEIELIDLDPDELLQRLREGKVYVPERAEWAIQQQDIHPRLAQDPPCSIFNMLLHKRSQEGFRKASGSGHARDLIERSRHADVRVQTANGGGHQVDRNRTRSIGVGIPQGLNASPHPGFQHGMQGSSVRTRGGKRIVRERLRPGRASPEVSGIINRLADPLRPADLPIDMNQAPVRLRWKEHLGQPGDSKGICQAQDQAPQNEHPDGRTQMDSRF